MLYLCKAHGDDKYTLLDTSNGHKEVVTKLRLKQLREVGINVYGVSKNFEVTVFETPEKIISSYKMRCMLCNIFCPEIKIKYRDNGGFDFTLNINSTDTVVSSVRIPEFVTMLNENTFEGIAGVDTVVIPDGVTKIGTMTFNRCRDLRTVVVPNSVTLIESYAFNDCDSLRDIYIMNKLSVVGVLNNAFPSGVRITQGIPY